MKHEHTPTPETVGNVYQCCECGAVRHVNREKNRYDEWHVCDLCRLPGWTAK